MIRLGINRHRGVCPVKIHDARRFERLLEIYSDRPYISDRGTREKVEKFATQFRCKTQTTTGRLAEIRQWLAVNT